MINSNSTNKAISQIFTPNYIAEFMVKNIAKLIKDNNFFKNK